MYKSSIAGALALLSTLPFAALADDPPGTGSADLGQVTVTATRTPLIADQEVAPVIVITQEQIRLAAGGDIGAVLRQYAGLDVAQTGGPGQPESLFMRGTNSNHTLVMIDGVRINPDNGFGSALQNIHLSEVERIEIVKGPRASLYGSDAIGGVINIITHRARHGLEYGAYAGAGRYGTYDSGANVGDGDDTSTVGASADDFHTAGFPAVAGAPFDSGNKDRSFRAYGDTRLGGLDLGLTHWQSAGYTQYIGFDSNPPFGLVPFDEDFRDATTALDLSGRPAGDWHSDLKLSHTVDEIDQRQADSFNFPPAPDFVHTQHNAVDWQNDLPLGDLQLLTAGAYYEDEHSATLSFGSPYDESHRVSALFLEDDLDLGAQRLVLAGRDTHDQEFGNHLTWNADYGYDFSADTKLTAGAGTAFRAPTATERFGFEGNPDLQPETSSNLELGLRQRFSDDQQATLSLFRNDLDDLIVFQPQPTPANPFAGENENVDKARVRGVELGYTLTLSSWTWNNDLIFQDPRDLGSDTTLLRRAKRTLTSNLTWHDDLTSAGISAVLTGPRPDVDFNTGAPVTDGGYLLLGASAQRDLGAGFNLLVRIDNLLDTRYQTASGYNTAGRSLYLQLEYRGK